MKYSDIEIDREIFNIAFKSLKPLCDELFKKPNLEDVNKLDNLLSTFSYEVRDEFKQYILVPAIVNLNKAKDDKQTLFALEHLRVVLNHIVINESKMFWDLHIILLQIAHNNPGSEELKLSLIQCFRALIRTTDKILDEFYEPSNHLKVGAVVHFCVETIKEEKFISLRVEALQCVIDILQLEKMKDETLVDKLFNKKMAEVAMGMLPGILICCVHVISSLSTQNHKIFILAVRLWGRILTRIVNLPEKVKPVSIFSINMNEKVNRNGDVRSFSREEYIDIYKDKIMKVIKMVVNVRHSDNWKVRNELAMEIDQLVSVCYRCLPDAVGILVDTLIVLSQDKHSNVVTTSNRALSKFQKKCQNDNSRTLVEIVEDCFYGLITKLPRILRGADLTLKHDSLLLLSGYLDILGSKQLPIILNSYQHLERFIKCLYIAATLDCCDVSLLENASFKELEDPVCENSWKRLKFCSSSECLTVLNNMCQKLVKYSEIYTLVMYLLDEFNSSNLYRLNITLLFNLMFSDQNYNFRDENEMLGIVFNAIMDPLVWKLPVEVDTEAAESRAEAKCNVIQLCLLTETVATLACAIGSQTFAPLLLRCLYPLLECAGSPIYLISTAGLQSVNRIAALYGGGVGELVTNNVDYLSHQVTINLKQVHKNPKVLSVLGVIMKHSSINVLPSLQEIINRVLLQSFDTFQDVNAVSFLQIFYTFVSCLRNWVAVEKPQALIKISKTTLSELLELKNSLTFSENIEINDDSNKREEEQKEKEESQVPDYIKFTVQIMNRALHFLPSKNESKQLLSLLILDEGVTILSSYENELLPVVHKIWGPLIERFDERNKPMLIRNAFGVLLTLGRTSKDFIRARALKQVFPSLCKILKSTSESSKNEKSTGAFVLSQKYKLQLNILQDIGTLCDFLEMSAKEIDMIMDALQPYLSKCQPLTLQQASVNSMLELAKKDANCVWISMISLSSSDISFNSPMPPLKTFRVKGVENDYYSNIQNVIEKL